MKLFEFIKILQRVKNQEREVYYEIDSGDAAAVVSVIKLNDEGDMITIG